MKIPAQLFAVIAVVVAIGSSVSLARSDGSGGPTDAVSTLAYLGAKYTFARALLTDVPAGLAAQNELAARVVRECPNVLRGAPHNKDAREVAREIVRATTLAADQPSRREIVKFRIVVRSLRWHNARITRLVQTIAALRESLARLRPPDLCDDAKAWAMGGFHTLGAGTIRFNKEMNPAIAGIAEGPGTSEEVLSRLLAPVETPSEVALVGQIKLIKQRASQQDNDVLHPAWVQIYDALGLIGTKS